MVGHACYPSTQGQNQKADQGFEASLVYMKVAEQPGLHSQTLSQQTKNNK